MLHIGILAKKHKQEGMLMSVIDNLSPFLEQLTEIYDRKLRFYFSAEDPLHYEDEIGSYIDQLQMLYELFKGEPDVERSKRLSEMLKIHIENYMDL